MLSMSWHAKKFMFYSTQHVKLDKKCEYLAWVPWNPRDKYFCFVKFSCRTFLSSVDGICFQRDTRGAPHKAFLAKFASSDTRMALSIFMCRVLYKVWLSLITNVTLELCYYRYQISNYWHTIQLSKACASCPVIVTQRLNCRGQRSNYQHAQGIHTIHVLWNIALSTCSYSFLISWMNCKHHPH